MLASLRTRTTKLKRNLTTLDGQPLGKAALIVIIFLDVFILGSIFDGLENHTRQMTTPDVYVPSYCRDIVLESAWSETTRLDNLARVASVHRNTYVLQSENERSKSRHPVCEPFVRSLDRIKADDDLSGDLAESARLQNEVAAARAELERVKGAYDTSLLESIAGQGRSPERVGALKNEVAAKAAVLDDLVRRQNALKHAIESDERVRGLYVFIAGITEADRTRLREELRRLNFWFPAKRLGMEMLFLLPLLLVFYFWNAKSLGAGRPFQTLVSSHLLVVAFVPVFLKAFQLLYDIIPKRLLKQVIELLESLSLVALWHYLVMAVSIAVALAVIFFLQKKLFSREKLLEKRIARGLCQGCGQRLPEGSRACPFCGFGQFRACAQCGKPTHVHGRYCRECGASNAVTAME